MVFARPTLEQIRTRVEGEIASRLGTGPLLPRSNLAVLARVLAGASHEMHGFLDWISRQVVPTTAEADQLERWGSLFGILRKAATFSEGIITLTGVDGSNVPAGTELRREDGVRYRTLAAGVIASGELAAPSRAVLEGFDGNAPAGVTLALVSPIVGVDPTAIAGTMAGGAAAESDQELRERLLQRVRQPPQGGAERDYVRWTLEVPGVTRAWCFRNYLGIGTVGVTFAVDDDPTGPIPSPAKVAEVDAYLRDGRRPVTAQLFVFAPVPFPIDLQVELDPDTPAVRQAVVDSVGDLLEREATPGQPVRVSHLREAISTSAGENDHDLLAPLVDVVVPTGALPVPGSVIWV